jgi:SAM-dependent methyltransferase
MSEVTMDVDPANAEQLRAWDGDEGSYWAAHSDRFDLAVAGYHDRFMTSAGIGSGDRVLDVGCGTGETTRDAARLAPSGSALGVDLSSAMLAVARQRAEAEGLANAAFEQVDAQVHRFDRGSFDIAISRTGAMFFSDPVAAFSNIGRALRSDGRLTLLVWQDVVSNEWIREISTALSVGRPPQVPPPEAPGPFSLADPDRVRRVLTGAGFTDVELEGLSAPMPFGTDTDDAFDFVLGLAGWMLDGLDDAGRRRALDALRATIADHCTEAGVAFDSATWLIQARRG